MGKTDVPDEPSVDEWLARVARIADLDPAPTIDAPALPVVERERYRIVGEHARGGMGRVLIAEDLRLGRRVAIKEILPRRGVNVVRFIREALVTARLEHPSIVPVHEVGRWPSGEPFYVMKFVAGRAFDAVVRELPTLGARLAYLPTLVAVAEAIAYAHSHRVVHRDLKPSNIMIGEFGETLVVDWGLAKRIDAGEEHTTSLDGGGAPSQTAVGAIVGTPGFMAPEQAAGLPIDERADLFALGALLYYLLAGAPPYDGTTVREVLDQLRAGPPEPLATRVPELPRDLAAVVEKAMAANPAARYSSAKELAADLRRFQTGSLVAARRYSRSERLVRWALRNRGPVGAAAGALAVVAVIGVASVRGVLSERDRANQERRVAVEERGRAEAARAAVQARVDELTLSQARAAVDDDPTAAVAWLKRLRPGSPRWAEARAIAGAADARGVAVAVLPGERFAFAPDGRLATVDRLGRVRGLGESGSAVESEAEPRVLAFAPDGRLLVGGGGLRAYDRGGREVASWRFAARQLAFTPDGAQVLAAGEHGLALLGPSATRTLAVGAAQDPRVSPDGTLVAARDQRGARLWTLEGAERPLARAGSGGGGLAFAPDGRALAAGVAGGIALWELPSGRVRRLAASGTVTAIAFAPDGAHLAACSDDGSAWLAALDGSTTPLSHQCSECRELAFSRDGRWLASTRGPTVRLWELSTLALRKLRGPQLDVTAVGFSPDSARLAVAGPDGGVRLWPLDRRARVVQLPAAEIGAVAVAPPCAATLAGGVITVEAGGRRELHDPRAGAIAWAPGAGELAAAGDDARLRW
jgi:eukaryotic-like serine/threonine-protein kinase